MLWAIGQIARQLLMLLLALTLPQAQAQAEAGRNRLALVIGNADYPKAALSNPKNDAHLIAESLKSLGFSIHGGVHTDLSVREMRSAIKSFSNALKQLHEPIAAFYYSGHGMEVDGKNYLLPVNFNTRELTDDPEYEAISLNFVLARLSMSNSANYLIFIDACRNNPYDKTKSLGKGLYDISATRGGLISFAAEPGHVALESHGSYSYYTQALAEEIIAPGRSVISMLRTVREKVRNATDGRQFPIVRDAIVGDDVILAQSAIPLIVESEKDKEELERLRAELENARRQAEEKKDSSPPRVFGSW